MTRDSGHCGDTPPGGARWSVAGEVSLQGFLNTPDCPPLLVQTLTSSMSWQNRNRWLVGRALVSPTLAPQWFAALLALGASVSLGGPGGMEEMALEELLQRRVAGEICSLHLRTDGLRWGYAQVARTPADEPIVAAVACVELEGDVVRQARLALTGAWTVPVGLLQSARLLLGDPLTEERIRAVATAAEGEATPRGDFRGSVEYRRAMVGVLTRRALEQCRQEEVDHG